MSVLCLRCKRDMVAGDTCTGDSLTIAGADYIRVRFGSEKWVVPRGFHCRDCNVAPGSLHHLDCAMEECPKCGQQLVSCRCLSRSVLRHSA